MTNCSHMWNFYCLQIFTILLLKQINILFKFECFCNNKKKKSTLPIDFSSDFSASVVLWCTSAVESVTLDSELLELLCFDPSASEDFWDNWSWLVNFSCYMTTNREKKPQTLKEWEKRDYVIIIIKWQKNIKELHTVTLSASSGTLISPLTTVNRLLCSKW